MAEPDVYIYLSVAQQTQAHNLTITSMLSGSPPRPYSEFPGLVLFPAYISTYLHISVQNIIYFSPVLMGLLGILAVYLLTEEFMHKRWVSLFAAFLYAALPAALYRSILGEYRGEVFVPVFLAFIMLLFIKTERKNAAWTIPGIIGLSALSIWWWSGGVYAIIAPLIFLGCAITFFLLPKIIKRTACNPLMRNRLTHAAIIAVIVASYPILMIIVPRLQDMVGGFISFQTSFISELAPTSVAWLFSYYTWVFIAAVLGLGLMIAYDKKESFHKPQYALFALFLPAIMMQTIAVRWLILFAVPGCIYGAYFVYALLAIIRVPRRRSIIIVVGLSAIALAAGISLMGRYQPADYINYQYLGALSWLKNNTASNATVLTMWPDGSVVEGYANRISLTDSIMSQNQVHIVAFEKSLYARAGNYSYIRNISPSYLLVRRTWLYETDGILFELGRNLNTSYEGTNLQQLLQINGTAPPPFPVVYRNNDTIIYAIKSPK